MFSIYILTYPDGDVKGFFVNSSTKKHAAGGYLSAACGVLCLCSLPERNDSAAIRGGSHTYDLPALRVHLVCLFFYQPCALKSILGETDN